jgi:hypothetical protein
MYIVAINKKHVSVMPMLQTWNIYDSKPASSIKRGGNQKGN